MFIFTLESSATLSAILHLLLAPVFSSYECYRVVTAGSCFISWTGWTELCTLGAWVYLYKIFCCLLPLSLTICDSANMWLSLQLYYVSFVATVSNHRVACVVYRRWDFAFSHSAIFKTKTPGTIYWKEFLLQRSPFEKKENYYFR